MHNISLSIYSQGSFKYHDITIYFKSIELTVILCEKERRHTCLCLFKQKKWNTIVLGRIMNLRKLYRGGILNARRVFSTTIKAPAIESYPAQSLDPTIPSARSRAGVA